MKTRIDDAKRQLVVRIVGAVIATVVTGFLLWFSFGQIRQHQDAAVKAVAGQMAAQQAGRIDTRLKTLTDQLAVIAQTSELQGLVESQDATAIAALGQRLHERNADIEHVLVVAGEKYEGLNLRFTQQTAIQQVEHGKPVLPEAFDNNGKWFFDIVVPVKPASEGGQIGALLITYQIHALLSALEEDKAVAGRTVLLQQFERTVARDVLTSGSDGRKEYQGVAPTRVAHWKVAFEPSSALVAQTIISPMIILVLHVVVFVIVLAALLVYTIRYVRAHAEELKKVEAHTPIQIKGARRIEKAGSAESGEEDMPPELELDDLSDPLFHSVDVLDLDGDDDDLLPKPGLNRNAQDASAASGAAVEMDVPATIFRDYDIRGDEQLISDALAERIGQAFGSVCLAQGQQKVVLAGDGRLSTPRLKLAVQAGILSTGCDVIDVGNVPTPLMYFATHHLGTQTGIMVTASHNPASDNGFKMVIAGRTLASEQIHDLRERVRAGKFASGEGVLSERAIIDDYVDHIVSDVALAGSYRVVLDCANGITGVVAPRLFEELGCDVIPMYADVDGSFPNHAPDPSDLANLQPLVERVRSEGADIGIAFDGDGDRLAVVTAAGEIVLPDRLLMLFAKDVVSRNPGSDIVFDVKSTRLLSALVSSYGGRPVMWKSGHSHIKSKMQETGALLGGELSGHIFFKERWFGFDDGMYSGARLLEILSIRDQSLDEALSSFSICASTPEIRVPVAEERKFVIARNLAERGEWGNGKLTTIDGVRVDFAKGWGLARASNTSAALTLRFEADDAESLQTVQQVFKQQLQTIEPGLSLPF